MYTEYHEAFGMPCEELRYYPDIDQERFCGGCQHCKSQGLTSVCLASPNHVAIKPSDAACSQFQQAAEQPLAEVYCPESYDCEWEVF